MKYRQPTVGSVYGKWTVITIGKKCLCECSCKRRCYIKKASLCNGTSTKCRSCRSRVNGLANRLFYYPDGCTKRLIYQIRSAIQRCTNTSHPRWDDWGGRGIIVYGPWLNDQVAFADYLMLLDGWDDVSLVIDRIDNDGNYEPGNLRFVTKSQSMRNRRVSRRTNT